MMRRWPWRRDAVLEQRRAMLVDAVRKEGYEQLTSAIREHGAATTIYISHGASGDWFVVEPQVGELRSMAGTPITTEMAVKSLLRAGRTVYKIVACKQFEKVGRSFDARHDGTPHINGSLVQP